MSFELELYTRPRSWAEAEEAASATASADHVAVVPGRRKRWGRELAPSMHFDWRQAQDVLSDDADWAEDAFTFDGEGRRKLVATVGALARVLDYEWGVRAYWGGDRLKHEKVVTPEELAGLIQESRLDRYTLYRVV